MPGHRVLESRTVFKGKILEVFVDTVALPDGTVGEREVVHHPGAVGVVAVGDPGFLLVRQNRHPVARDLLEIPAGKLDRPGEEPEECARRELEEETGYRCRRLELLIRYLSSPGFTDEEVWVFLATEIEEVGQAPDHDDGEPISIEWMPVSKAPAAIASGEVLDAKTVIGLLLAAPRLRP